MLNFDFKKSARKCSESGVEFQPGEVFFSALLELPDGSTARRDFHPDNWQGPPDDCLGWWKSRVPERDKGRIFWAPRKVMFAYFEHLLSSPRTQDIAFVTGLLLVQKRYLQWDDQDSDRDMMRLRDRSGKCDYEIEAVEISPTRMGEIQNELSERLFTDELVEPDDDDPDLADELSED